MNYNQGLPQRENLLNKNNSRSFQSRKTEIHLFTGQKKSIQIQQLIKQMINKQIHISTHVNLQEAENLIGHFNNKQQILIIIFDVSPERNAEYSYIFSKYSKKIQNLFFLAYPAKSKFQNNYSFDNTHQIIQFCMQYYKKVNKIKLSSIHSLSKDKSNNSSRSLSKNAIKKPQYNKLYYQIDIYNDYGNKTDSYHYDELTQKLGQLKQKAMSFHNIGDLQMKDVFKNKNNILILTSTNSKAHQLIQIIRSKKIKHVHLILFGQLRPSSHYLDQSIILATNSTHLVVDCLNQNGFSHDSLTNFMRESKKQKILGNSGLYRSSLYNMRSMQNSGNMTSSDRIMRGSMQDQQKPVHHWMIDKQNPNSDHFTTFQMINSNIKVQKVQNKIIKNIKSPMKQQNSNRQKISQRHSQTSNIQKLYEDNPSTIINSDKIIYNNINTQQFDLKYQQKITANHQFKSPLTNNANQNKQKIFPSNIIHEVSQEYRGSNLESNNDDTSVRMFKNPTVSGFKSQSFQTIKNNTLQQHSQSYGSNEMLINNKSKGQQNKISSNNIIQLNTNNYIHQNINNYNHDGLKMPSFNYVSIPQTIIISQTPTTTNKHHIYQNYASPPKIFKKETYIPQQVYFGSTNDLSKQSNNNSQKQLTTAIKINTNKVNVIKKSQNYLPAEINYQNSKTNIQGNYAKKSQNNLPSQGNITKQSTSKNNVYLNTKKSQKKIEVTINNKNSEKKIQLPKIQQQQNKNNQIISGLQRYQSPNNRIQQINEYNKGTLQANKPVSVVRGNEINIKHINYTSPIDQLRPFNNNQRQSKSPVTSPINSRQSANHTIINTGGINLSEYERIEENGKIFYRMKKSLTQLKFQDKVSQGKEIKKVITPLIEPNIGQVKYETKYFNSETNKIQSAHNSQKNVTQSQASSRKEVILEKEFNKPKNLEVGSTNFQNNLYNLSTPKSLKTININNKKPAVLNTQQKNSQKKISDKMINPLNESNMFSRMSQLHSDGSILRRNNIRFGVKLAKKPEVTQQQIMQSKLLSGIYKFNEKNRKNTLNRIIRGEQYIDEQNRKLFHINTSFNNFHYIIYQELQYLKKILQAYVSTKNDRIDVFTGTQQLFQCIRPQKVQDKYDAGFIFIRLQDISTININLLPEDYYIFTIQKSQEGILQINEALKRVKVDKIKYLSTIQKIIIDRKLYQYVAYRNNKPEIEQLADKFLQSQFILEKIETQFSSEIIDFYYCQLPRLTRLYLLCDENQLAQLLKLIKIYEEFNPNFDKQSCKLICILSDILKNDDLIMNHPNITFISNPDGIQRHEDILKYAHHSQQNITKIISIDNIFYHQKLQSLQNKIHSQFPGRFNIFPYLKLQDVYMKIDKLSKLKQKNLIKQNNYLILHESMNNQYIQKQKFSKVFMYGKAKVVQGQVIRVLNAEQLFQLLKI